MSKIHPGRRSGPAAAPTIALALAASLALAGCDSLLSSEAGLGDEAVIQVTGSGGAPLLVVTSTNFLWEYNLLDNEYTFTVLKADTVRLATLPYTGKQDLRRRDRFLVRLINPDLGAEADVGMDVRLDGRLVYSQKALLRDATLEYFTWFSPDSGY